MKLKEYILPVIAAVVVGAVLYLSDSEAVSDSFSSWVNWLAALVSALLAFVYFFSEEDDYKPGEVATQFRDLYKNKRKTYWCIMTVLSFVNLMIIVDGDVIPAVIMTVSLVIGHAVIKTTHEETCCKEL